MAIRIVIAGEIYIDHVMTGLGTLPIPGEERFATNYTRELGGGAPHTAAAWRKLGASVMLAGPTGESDTAWVEERLQELDVASQWLLRVPDESTGLTFSASAEGDRALFSYLGANSKMDSVMDALPAWDHLHLAYPCPANRLAELAQQGSVSIDVGWHPDWMRDDDILQALRSVRWFLPNEREAQYMTGEREPTQILAKFAEWGVRVAIKLGAGGCAARNESGELVYGPPLPIDAVDTTGAGDNFNAGFLDAWLNRYPLRDCLIRGNICGALSTRAIGGMQGLSSKEEVDDCHSKLR